MFSQMLDTDQITQLARRFWHALKSAPFDETHGNLTGFPNECCHHASILFSIYLVQHHDQESTVVFAKRGLAPERRHVWVDYKGIVIDLTCGQFRDVGLPDFYVGPSSSWHDTWERVDQDTSIMDDVRTERNLSGAYQGPYDLVVAQLFAAE